MLIVVTNFCRMAQIPILKQPPLGISMTLNLSLSPSPSPSLSLQPLVVVVAVVVAAAVPRQVRIDSPQRLGNGRGSASKTTARSQLLQVRNAMSTSLMRHTARRSMCQPTGCTTPAFISTRYDLYFA
jgi:hypothetical protein